MMLQRAMRCHSGRGLASTLRSERKKFDGNSHRTGLVTAGSMLVGLSLFGAFVKNSNEEELGFYSIPHDASWPDRLRFAPTGGVIGEGSFGVVRIAQDLLTNEELAVKIILENEDNRIIVENELEALELLRKSGGHKNIVNFKAMERKISPKDDILTQPRRYQDQQQQNYLSALYHGVWKWLGNPGFGINVVPYQAGDLKKKEAEHTWILFERVNGHELYDEIINRGAMSERSARPIFSQIVDAVQFLHEHVGLVHSDLKPENVLISKRDGRVKICDFGSSLRLASDGVHVIDEKGISSIMGTLAYASPEMLQDKRRWSFKKKKNKNAGQQEDLTKAVDVWSLGCLLYILLSARHPFDLEGDRTDQQVVNAIKYENVAFERPEWKHVSSETKELISRMLEKEPSKRITMDEVLQHSFFTSN